MANMRRNSADEGGVRLQNTRSRPSTRSWCLPLLWGLIVGLLGSCGYSQEALIPIEARRVAVPIFENETFYRELEFPLTDEVIRQLHSRPDVVVVTPEEAQVIIRGTITELRQRVLSEDESDRARESTAQTFVRVIVIDAESGEAIKTYTVQDRADFAFARGETLLQAQEESFVDLARRVVWGLERGF